RPRDHAAAGRGGLRGHPHQAAHDALPARTAGAGRRSGRARPALMAAAPTYAVAAGDVGRDREAVLDVWRGNLGEDARMRAKYDWFYRKCPYGEPLLRLLRLGDGASPVGAAAAGPRRMDDGTGPLEAGVLVDLAVRAEHRSLGP